MQQFVRSKWNNANPIQLNYQATSKSAQKRRIPKIGSRQIPTHTFYKTFYHHKDQYTRQMNQPMHFNSRQSKDYSQKPFRNSYDRPVHLLKKYLERKQRLNFYEEPTSNKSQPISEKNMQFRTMNEFRIKKSKKMLDVSNKDNNNPEIQAMPSKVINKSQSLDDDFANFNASKNLYAMTFEELEESIRWKKQFLELLSIKMKDNQKKISYRIKHFA